MYPPNVPKGAKGMSKQITPEKAAERYVRTGVFPEWLNLMNRDYVLRFWKHERSLKWDV